MQIKAAELKAILKKVAVANATNLSFDFTAGSVAAPDTDITAVVISPLLRSEDAAFTVAAKQFTSIISKLSGEISILRNKDSIELKSAKSRFELPAFNQKPAAVPKPSRVWAFPLKVTREILQYAVTAANSRKSGLQFHYETVVQLSPSGPESEHGVMIRAVGTNGQRMAIADSFMSLRDSKFRLLIPALAVNALGIFDGETLHIGESESTIHFGVGNSEASTTIVARKQAKEFPNHESAIPGTFSFIAKVKAEELRESLRLLEPVAVDELKRTTLSFNGDLKLQAGADQGNAENIIPFEQIEPDPVFDEAKFRITLSHTFLSDFVESVEGEIKISGNGPHEPLWLEAGSRKLLIAAIR